VHSLYGSKTGVPEDDSVESKHVALISHYMFNITTVVFDWPSHHYIVQTLRYGTPQFQIMQILSVAADRQTDRHYKVKGGILKFYKRA